MNSHCSIGHGQSSMGECDSHCCRIACCKLLSFILLFPSLSSVVFVGGRWTHIAVEYNIFQITNMYILV